MQVYHDRIVFLAGPEDKTVREAKQWESKVRLSSLSFL